MGGKSSQVCETRRQKEHFCYPCRCHYLQSKMSWSNMPRCLKCSLVLSASHCKIALSVASLWEPLQPPRWRHASTDNIFSAIQVSRAGIGHHCLCKIAAHSSAYCQRYQSVLPRKMNISLTNGPRGV